ncbi:MAG: tRNA-specific 2-thiouridylase [Candidatus Nomurabacteria bacterium]|jgi:tRNA-specific 2-thiouridylase|nr:tRNA-specific 2-thiouridylase [Candidatus Nomurabacteria bacterium]
MSKNSAKKVYVGMSGGVDSSLSAALLCEAGYDVTGVFMKNWTRDLPGMQCPWAEDLADAKRVAVQLGIPLRVFDFQTEYKHLVVDYMIREYRAGRTPNPDTMCNQEVKFGLFLRAALAEGAEMIATGHYARVGNNSTRFPSDIQESRHDFSGQPLESPQELGLRLKHHSANQEPDRKNHSDSFESSSNRTELLRAVDANKDQTYFLYRITEAALGRTLFPIGHLTKPEVRAEAERRGLVTAGRRDSQGICFVGSVGIRDFLSQFVETAPGDIIEQETGKTVGRHDGAIFYTFGQRHGLSIGGGLPYYVVSKNMAKNEVYVSTNLNSGDFWREELHLTDTHWINAAPEPNKTYQARLRHRAPLIDCSIEKNLVRLAQAERAVAPGQSAAIYDGEICLGGGVIAS